MKLNFFLPKDGFSEYHSPRMKVDQECIHDDEHCAISFGTYVQAAMKALQHLEHLNSFTRNFSATNKVVTTTFILEQAT